MNLWVQNMKMRSKETGCQVDHWSTPQYVYDYLDDAYFHGRDFFDPCPLQFEVKNDGLIIDWGPINYINPPYQRVGKEAFIRKSYEEFKKGKLCIMLIPATTETEIFHDIIVPNARVELIRRRIKFRGYNSRGEYVTNKTGQTGSMFVVFGKEYKPIITTVDISEYERKTHPRGRWKTKKINT